MIENVSPPQINVTDGLADRRVSMVEFPWRNLSVSEYGRALLSLIEHVLEDGPDAAAALARAFEGAEVLCERDIRLDAGTIQQLSSPIARLREFAATDPTVLANEWFLWGIDALAMAVDCSQPRDELFPYLRAARLTAECFCAGQQLAARHGGQASVLHSSAHAVN